MKTYKIRRFCQHMGVTLDTVKHYQNCGILSPIVDPDNNYRYYNITHGERLIVSRKFRNLGFTIEDTTAMVSSKNGSEIQKMLIKRNEEINQSIEKLKDTYQNIQYLIEVCDLFNHQVNTYSICQRPAYYVYRHILNSEFINDTMSETLTRGLMNQLPNAVKLMILPFRAMREQNSEGCYHTIALKESFSKVVNDSDLKMMEYFPEVTCIRYIYSKPHAMKRFGWIDGIYNELIQQGFLLTEDDILIENAIDYYQDGVRYENYLIYFPIAL